MNNLLKPVKFEQFLLFKKFQKIFLMQHFHIERDEYGRLVDKARIVFYMNFALHICFLSGMVIALVQNFNQGLSNDAILPVFTIGAFFEARGITMFIKRHDVVKFLNILDKEFPHDWSAQKAHHVPQAYERTLKRHKYVEIVINGALLGFCLLPAVVYIFTRDPNGPITVEQQLLGGYLPFDLRESHKAYPLALFYDILCAVSGTSYFMTFDTIFYTTHGQIIMHLDNLSKRMEMLNWTSEDDTQLYDQLCTLIRRHQHLNLLCDQFNNLFNAGVMITDFMAATTICFHLFLLSETEDLFFMLRYLIPTVTLTAFTFELCLRGSQLEDAVRVLI